MTLDSIESLIRAEATKLELSGVINDSLIKLLAYGVYINNANLNSKLLNSLAASTTNTDAAISHAMQNLYSVYRGTNTTATFRNVISNTTKTFDYLDMGFRYNGYYFYYNEDIDTTMGSMADVTFIMSDRQLMDSTVTANDDSFVYLDFVVGNVSESVVLEGLNSTGNWERLTFTKDAYDFFRNEKNEDGSYKYGYLLTTGIGYSVRMMRRLADDDSRTWEYTQYRIRYIPYSEFVPDLTALKSCGDWEYVEELDDVNNSSHSSIEVNKFYRRMSDTEKIYARSTKSYLSRGQIGSKADIENIILQQFSTETHGYIDVYNIVSAGNKGYRIYIKGNGTDVENIKSALANRCPFEIEVLPMDRRRVIVSIVATNAYYSANELTDYFRKKYQNRREVNLDELMVEILRYDSHMESCNIKFSEDKDLTVIKVEDGQYIELEFVKG